MREGLKMRLNQLMWRTLLRVFLVALPLAVLAVWVGQTASVAALRRAVTESSRAQLRRALVKISDRKMLDRAWKAAGMLPADGSLTDEQMDRMLRKAEADEIHICDTNAVIVRTSVPEYLGMDLRKHRQTLPFCALLGRKREYAQEFEDSDFWDYMMEVWRQMCKCVEAGLEHEGVLPGRLHLRRKATSYYVRATGFGQSLQSRGLVCAYALAASEENASGGTVVTAPTCGSCGVVPSVLYHMSRSHNFSEKDILKALATAGLFGNVIRTNASLSGAEVGCQGEVGSACVMAAVAVNQLFGGSIQQIEYAAVMAMEHHLGLTCDPICGLVQIPCIERNPMAALRALDVSFYALLGEGTHIINFDKVIDTMKRTGHDLPSLYKETAIGGLATLVKDSN